MSSYGHDPLEYFTPSDNDSFDTEPLRVSLGDTARSIGAFAIDLIESAQRRIEAIMSPEVPAK